MMAFKLDNTHELAAKCRDNFPNLRSRLIFSIGEWGMIHGSKTDYFLTDGKTDYLTSSSKKIGFKITRHYDRKQLPIYNNKTRVYIYTGE